MEEHPAKVKGKGFGMTLQYKKNKYTSGKIIAVVL